MTYEGPERRKFGTMSQEDHDLLLKISSDTDHLVRSFDAHVQDDRAQFKEIKDGQEWIKKCIFLAIGGATVIGFILKAIGVI